MALSKRQRTKIQIMHTAKGLFEKQGVENVTFAQIADSAGVCRTTVFNHFGCVNDLMLAIFQQEMDDLEHYCKTSKLEGLPLIKGLFFQLFTDVSYYPTLSIKLANNAIISDYDKNPIIIIEDLVEDCLRKEGIENAGELAGMITGSYFGLVNHYKIRKKEFNIDDLQRDFCGALKHILGGHYYD